MSQNAEYKSLHWLIINVKICILIFKGRDYNEKKIICKENNVKMNRISAHTKPSRRLITLRSNENLQYVNIRQHETKWKSSAKKFREMCVEGLAQGMTKIGWSKYWQKSATCKCFLFMLFFLCAMINVRNLCFHIFVKTKLFKFVVTQETLTNYNQK